MGAGIPWVVESRCDARAEARGSSKDRGGRARCRAATAVETSLMVMGTRDAFTHARGMSRPGAAATLISHPASSIVLVLASVSSSRRHIT